MLAHPSLIAAILLVFLAVEEEQQLWRLDGLTIATLIQNPSLQHHGEHETLHTRNINVEATTYRLTPDRLLTPPVCRILNCQSSRRAVIKGQLASALTQSETRLHLQTPEFCDRSPWAASGALDDASSPGFHGVLSIESPFSGCPVCLLVSNRFAVGS